MSLVKHIVVRCSANKQLGDAMSDILSALLIKLDELSSHEDEMKVYKKPLTEVHKNIVLMTIEFHCYALINYQSIARAANYRMAELFKTRTNAVSYREEICQTYRTRRVCTMQYESN